ncbi:MAG: hypothetical protein IJO59_02005 [Clostridia bacterium]|nr:hypothetical protein [Clostridia bacterium]
MEKYSLESYLKRRTDAELLLLSKRNDLDWETRDLVHTLLRTRTASFSMRQRPCSSFFHKIHFCLARPLGVWYTDSVF